jgi:hypothetical protein
VSAGNALPAGAPPECRPVASPEPGRPGSCPRSSAHVMATWWSPFVDVPTGRLMAAGSKGYTCPPATPIPRSDTTRRSRSVQRPFAHGGETSRIFADFRVQNPLSKLRPKATGTRKGVSVQFCTNRVVTLHSLRSPSWNMPHAAAPPRPGTKPPSRTSVPGTAQRPMAPGSKFLHGSCTKKAARAKVASR